MKILFKKSVRLAHTCAGARLCQQPSSSARSAPPAGGFCVMGNYVSHDTKKAVPPATRRITPNKIKRKARDGIRTRGPHLGKVVLHP